LLFSIIKHFTLHAFYNVGGIELVKRISFKDYCGECFQGFNLYELTYYLPIDNDSFCNKCKDILDSRTYCFWIENLFLGSNEEAAKINLIKLVQLFNETVEDHYSVSPILLKE
jgi:hypothetical protein